MISSFSPLPRIPSFAQNTITKENPVTRLLQEVQTRSIDVARLSYAIAQQCTQLSADDALLAGLVHDIGYLPLLQALSKSEKLNNIDDDICRFLKLSHPQVGGKILLMWKFPDIFIDVARQHEQLARTGNEHADLVDVIIIANLLLHEQNKPEKDLSDIKVKISAYTRLNLNVNCSISDFNKQLETATQLLPV